MEWAQAERSARRASEMLHGCGVQSHIHIECAPFWLCCVVCRQQHAALFVETRADTDTKLSGGMTVVQKLGAPYCMHH